jgi:hypothetical protein
MPTSIEKRLAQLELVFPEPDVITGMSLEEKKSALAWLGELQRLSELGESIPQELRQARFGDVCVTLDPSGTVSFVQQRDRDGSSKGATV